MTSNIVLPRTFSTANLSFSKINVNLTTKSRSCYVNYNEKPFQLQTPLLSIPYDLNVYDKDDKGNMLPQDKIKYAVSLSLKGYNQPGSKVKELFDMLTAFDDYMVEQGVKNSRAWFKTDTPKEIVTRFYKPVVRFSKDTQTGEKKTDKDGNVYPPTMELKLPFYGNAKDPKLFNSMKQPYEDVPFKDILVKLATGRFLVQANGLYFIGDTKYVVSFKLVQAVMESIPMGVSGCAVMDDDEDGMVNDDDVMAAPAPTPAPIVKNSAIAAVLPDMADEDEDSVEPDDVEPVPLPKKPAASATTVMKKKVVGKK